MVDIKENFRKNSNKILQGWFINRSYLYEIYYEIYLLTQPGITKNL